MRGIIYCYCVNNKYYIGKTYGLERKRKDKHKHEALTKKADTPFARAIRKYGWDNVVKTYRVLEVIECDNKRQLNEKLVELENKHIIEKNSIIPNGYNVNASGTLEIPIIENKDDVYRKISKSLKGKYMNQEYSSKKIVCIELDKEYPSISECARDLGITRQAICSVLSGRTVTAKGYTFKYADKDKNREYKKIKKVLCIETGEEFKSLRKASLRFSGKDNQHSNIALAIKNGWAYKGYHFKYIT